MSSDSVRVSQWTRQRIGSSSPELMDGPSREGIATAFLVGSNGTSSPFVRAPAEDRSKYEKLIHDFEDVSSDDSHTSQPEAVSSRVQRKRHRVRSNLAAVADRKLKKVVATMNPNPDPKCGGHLSDDSIGSASDLRAMNEDEAQGEVDEEGRHNCNTDNLNDETISESIITCGSSAYHAECESLATHDEEEERCRRKIPTSKCDAAASSQQIIAKNEVDINDGHDLLFVGHQYGEKPLLADDELDTDGDDDGGVRSPSPVHNRHPVDEEANKGISWEKNSLGKDIIIDVFALAPFQKPGGATSRRSSCRGSNRKVSGHYQSRSQPTSQTVSPMDVLTGGCKSSLLISTSPFSHPITPPQELSVSLQDAPLVDFGEPSAPNSTASIESKFIPVPAQLEPEEGPRNLPQHRYENVLDAPFQEQKENSIPDMLCSSRFENSVHFTSSVPPIAEQDEDPLDGGGSSKDLFGSSPFSSGSYVVNPFSSNSSSSSTCTSSGVVAVSSIVSPLNPYQITTPSPVVFHQQDSLSITNPQPEFFSSSQKFLLQNPECHSLESPGSPASVINVTMAADLATSPTGVTPVSAIIRQPNKPQQDLFGAVPFSKMTSQILTKHSQSINFTRPTTLPLRHVSSASDTVTTLKADHRHSYSVSPAAVNILRSEPLESCCYQGGAISSSLSEANRLKGSNDTSPKLLQRKDKTKSGDKSKYHLIEDCRIGKPEKLNVLPSKLSHKTGKSMTSSSFRKSSKVSKKVGGEKTLKVSAAGFSNMSFEDFPSDEGDEVLTEQMVVPFEVIRGEKQAFDVERKFGSLKRRSNPFS